MSLGPYRGGCVRLWRGASGKPVDEAPPGEKVLIGDGLEECLTACCAAPEYRTVCALSLANLASAVLPPLIAEIIILTQNDPPNSPAARALDKAASVFRSQGRHIRIGRPPQRFKDLNDVARHDAARGTAV